MLRENTAAVQQREQEILGIVKVCVTWRVQSGIFPSLTRPCGTQSINELAVIFKELSTLVVDQGTILDRIDYNIEVAATHVEKGHKELVKVH